MSNEKKHSALLQSILAVLSQLTQEEVRFLLSQCTEKNIELERAKLAKIDANVNHKSKNQYKNNYYRK